LWSWFFFCFLFRSELILSSLSLSGKELLKEAFRSLRIRTLTFNLIECSRIKTCFIRHSLILSPSPLIPSFFPQIPRLLLLEVPDLHLSCLLRRRGGWRRRWRRRPRPRQRFYRRIRRRFGWGFRRGWRVRSAWWIQVAESRQAMQRSQGVRRRSHRRWWAHLRLRSHRHWSHRRRLPEVVRYDILFVFIITRQALFVCVLIHTDHMQVGLRLFLSPVTSNLLLRTAWYHMLASLQSFLFKS